MTVSPESQRIILIDADERLRNRTARALAAAGYRVEPFRNVALAEQSRAGECDAVLAAMDWQPGDNRQRIPSLRQYARGAPLILLCPPARVRDAVRSLKDGIHDYLLRPPDRREIRGRLQRILDQRDADSRLAYFQNEISKRTVEKKLVASSPAMQAVVGQLLRVAPMRATVLIYGESGVGKELIARSIHFHSARRERPFIALNCAAMPANLIESELFGHEKGSFTGAHSRTRGKFEIAHRGTLFLDEIGEMDPGTQAKLLRVLEEREFMRVGGDRNIRVDVRVIAATNAPLEQLVSEGRFRQDLYYRLKVVILSVPPLRDRREDMPRLATTFLDELARSNAVAAKVLEPEALAAFEDYPWPGNVRELKNLLESALVSVPGGSIRLEDLPEALRRSHPREERVELTAGMTIARMERELILRTLEQTGGNRTHSASLLGIGVRTLQRKIHSYGIRIAPRRRRPRGDVS